MTPLPALRCSGSGSFAFRVIVKNGGLGIEEVNKAGRPVCRGDQRSGLGLQAESQPDQDHRDRSRDGPDTALLEQQGTLGVVQGLPCRFEPLRHASTVRRS
jgi:hypothetical protein